MPLQIPNDETLDAYYKQAQPLYGMLLNNAIESTHLERIRNALLPKLLSGEIDVSKIERLTLPNNHL